MIGPVGHRGEFARQLRQPPGQQVAERGPGDIVIDVAALDEIERHVQRVIDIALEAHAGLEGERQHAGAVGIRIGPDLRAHRQEAVGLAVGEGRIGEQRGEQRLQAQRQPHLRDHVGFRGEVDVGLHGGGAEHHVEAEAADLGHVARHDLVALLGHDRRLVAAPQRAHAEVEETDAQRPRARAPAPRNGRPVRPRSDARRRAARPTIRTGRPAPAKWRRRLAGRTDRSARPRPRSAPSRCLSRNPSSSALMPSRPDSGAALIGHGPADRRGRKGSSRVPCRSGTDPAACMPASSQPTSSSRDEMRFSSTRSRAMGGFQTGSLDRRDFGWTRTIMAPGGAAIHRSDPARCDPGRLSPDAIVRRRLSPSGDDLDRTKRRKPQSRAVRVGQTGLAFLTIATPARRPRLPAREVAGACSIQAGTAPCKRRRRLPRFIKTSVGGLIDDGLAFRRQALRLAGRPDQRLRLEARLVCGEEGRRRAARLLDREPVEVALARRLHRFAARVRIAAQFGQRRAAEAQRRFERFADLVIDAALPAGRWRGCGRRRARKPWPPGNFRAQDRRWRWRSCGRRRRWR